MNAKPRITPIVWG